MCFVVESSLGTDSLQVNLHVIFWIYCFVTLTSFVVEGACRTGVLFGIRGAVPAVVLLPVFLLKVPIGPFHLRLIYILFFVYILFWLLPVFLLGPFHLRLIYILFFVYILFWLLPVFLLGPFHLRLIYMLFFVYIVLWFSPVLLLKVPVGQGFCTAYVVPFPQ